MCVEMWKCRRVFVFTDLLNTPVLVNAQHNHWTVTCQIRAYPVHYTHLPLSLYTSDTFLSALFSQCPLPLSPLMHHTSSFFFFFTISYMLFRLPLFLGLLCLIIIVPNVSMYPCRWGPVSSSSSSREEGVCRGNWP